MSDEKAVNANKVPLAEATAEPSIELIDKGAPTAGEALAEVRQPPADVARADVDTSSNATAPHQSEPISPANPPEAPSTSASAIDSGSEKRATVTENFGEVQKLWLANFKNYYGWLWGLRAPLFLLFAIGLAPKLVLLWILIVLARPVSIWAYSRLPEHSRARLKMSLPKQIRHSAFLHDLGEGADQGLPFILFWLYLCCAPFAVVWIAVHWVRGFFGERQAAPTASGGFVFTQNKRMDPVHAETNFYHSRAFGVVFLAFFALGIPAFFAYNVYQHTGMERTMNATKAVGVAMGNASVPPPVPLKPIVGIASPKDRPQLPSFGLAPTGADATYVLGYNGFWPFVRDLGIEPSKSSVFFVHFYLVSLASALTMLFFRAWFLFPLNFLSDEHDVEFTEYGIKRRSMKGWFLSVLTINRWSTGGGPDSLDWSEVKSLRRLEDGFARLYPLPETAFKKESLSYKLLNKVAALMDGLTNRMNTGNYLVFSTAEKEGDFGRNIKINLNDLNREQRAKLFYAVKKWAPHAVVTKAAEEQLLGSTVLENVRYTQLWFDLLTSRTRVRRQNALNAGEVLKDGRYIIDERIASGGQATTYLATRAAGDKCVLKEFILSTSSTSGALVESAREFEAEVSLLSQLQHSGIVRLDDFFTEGGRVYVVLEYIEGRSLRQLIQQEGALDEVETAKIAHAVCEVLEYLHGCNPPIVHRDITPENILVRADGSIKLIDFSLAVRQDGRQTTDSCAKQAFTPPEQFREEPCPQSDIYALGATMYFMLTGVTPKPISVSSPAGKAAQTSPEMNAIVERATQLELSQRYEAVHWLKLELAGIAKKQAVHSAK